VNRYGSLKGLLNLREDAAKLSHGGILPQRQDSLLEQLEDLHQVAQELGMYDAADWMRKRWDVAAPHTTSITTVRGPFGFIPRCSCGWHGILHDVRGEAEATATEHKTRPNT
jgi:hypothetical protein